MKTASFLLEITLTRSLSYKTPGQNPQVRRVSHLPEEHILDLLLLLLTKKNNKMFQFSILASKGNFDSFAYSCKH